MRWRLVAVFVGITLVVLAAHDIPLRRHLQQVEHDRLVTGLERDSFVLAGRAEESLESGAARGDPGLQQVIDAYRAGSGARVVITDRTGTAVAISDEETSAGSSFATRPEIASALAGNLVAGERDSTTLGFRLLYVAVPVLSGDSVVGTVRLTFPAAEVGRRVSRRVGGLAIVAAISILTAAAAAAVLAGTISRPLRRLRIATDHLAGGDLTVTAADDEGPPEIRGLAAAFNTMATRLRRMVEGQRSFAGDASHQLRTPLTALRLRLEQAAELVDSDPVETRARIEAAAAETERLQHLVDGLLVLARAEGRDDASEVVDIAAVARERVEVWQPLAEEQGVTLNVEAPATAHGQAVPGAVEQIIDNYLDNALAATPGGGRIDVEVIVDVHVGVVAEHDGSGDRAAPHASTGPFVVVHVRDTGPGMTDEQLAKAFDRFWRAPGSAAQGSGLGLAIVAQLAGASGAFARVQNGPDGGIDASAAFAQVR